jgi:hypothetical protein
VSDDQQDFTAEFDAPLTEAVKGVGDVLFSRATMEYWATWATTLKQKRLNEYKLELDRNGALNAAAKVELLSRAKVVPIQLFEVMDQQYTPDGIQKILLDGYTRAGGKASDWPNIAKRIGPRRQQQLATEICSEPVPTSAELRQALRDLLRKAQKAVPPTIETMSDDDLIAAARQFQPEPDKGGDGPLSVTPGSESAPGSITSTAA